MKVHILFDRSGSHIAGAGSVEACPPAENLDALVDSLRTAQAELRAASVDDIIALLDAVAHEWSHPSHPLSAVLRERELGFLTLWMRKRNLQRWLDLSLRGDRLSLDAFKTLLPADPRLFKAQPRGIVVHWVAGNVPVLGIISIVQALITKNASIVKVPGNDAALVPMLLASMRSVSCVGDSGKELRGDLLTNAICAVYSSRDDIAAGRELSRVADVRLAWGGREAVEAIMNLPRRFGTEDIIFGPKLSFAVVGAEMLSAEAKATQIARAIARDASAFDQRGCNSPHTVFVEKGGEISPREFAKILATAMQDLHAIRPLGALAASESMEILTHRAEYAMRADAWHSRGMGWTVLFSEDDSGLGGPCYARTVFVRSVNDVFDAVPLCSHSTQTIGVALGDRRLEFSDRATAQGVDRCPDVGRMSLYETPWDGMFASERLVRWVSN